MFDVGFTEILLIGIVSLIVIGPERLPAVARTVGQWVGKMQRFVRGVKTDLASELETGDLKKLIGDQREQINELRSMVSSAKKDFETTTREVVENTKSGLSDLESTINDAKKDVDAPKDVNADGSEAVDSAASTKNAGDTDSALTTDSTSPGIDDAASANVPSIGGTDNAVADGHDSDQHGNTPPSDRTGTTGTAP